MALSITTSQLPAGQAGSAYRATLQASGGGPPYRWSATLPTALKIDAATGVISGTPAAAALQTVLVGVRDQAGGSASAYLQLVIQAAVLSFLPVTLAEAWCGQPVPARLSAAGGAPPYAFSTPSGGLPPGLTLDRTGTFAGAPATAGAYSPVVQATDSAGAKASAVVTIVVSPPMAVPQTSATIYAGQKNRWAIAVQGGRPPYTVAFSPPLPIGLEVEAAGILQWTPPGPAVVQLKGTATDSMRAAIAFPYTISVMSAGGLERISALELSNGGWFVCAGEFEWNLNGQSGQSERAGALAINQSETMDPGELGVPPGATVRLYIWIAAGDDRTGGQVFIYDPQASQCAMYEITGTTLDSDVKYGGLRQI